MVSIRWSWLMPACECSIITSHSSGYCWTHRSVSCLHSGNTYTANTKMRDYYFFVSRSRIPRGAGRNPTSWTNPVALHFHTMTVFLSSNFDRMSILIKFQSHAGHIPTRKKPWPRHSPVLAKKKNYKGRRPNEMRYIESCGSEVSIVDLIAPNLAAGAITDGACTGYYC